MAKNAAQLLKDALELPEPQRIELAWGLLDSLERTTTRSACFVV
jgi:hypothetical protein